MIEGWWTMPYDAKTMQGGSIITDRKIPMGDIL
jgi:hypothetical protein